MIIDDEQEMASLVAKRVRFMGYDVTCVFEGNEALEKIRLEKPDLVLLDLWLPDVSGLDIYNQLRADPLLATLPVIFFSADPSQENHCLKTLKANGFIKKPYDSSELMAQIHANIGTSH